MVDARVAVSSTGADLIWLYLAELPGMALAPELSADRQRIAAGAALAVVTRHEPPRLDLIAPGALPGAAVVVMIRRRGAGARRRSPADRGRRRPGQARQARAAAP